MKILKGLLLCIGFLLFEFATGWVRAFDVIIDLPIMFVKYALFAWYLIGKRKMNPQMVVACGIMYIISIPILGYVIDGKIMDVTIPNFLSATLGILYGAVISKKHTMKGFKILIPFIVGIFSIWYIFFNGFAHWCQIIDGESFTGRMKPGNIELKWKVCNRSNDTFTSAFYKDKIVYFDFWSTNCGVCFIKFPELEKLYQKYKGDTNLIIQAVNIPIERDSSGMAFYMVERRGNYNFPIVIGTDSMRLRFGVEAYPTVVILKNNKIVFRGRTELATEALKDILNETE